MTLPDGAYGGRPLAGEQLRIVEAIWRACKDASLTDRDAVIALITADTESNFQTGPAVFQKDADSVGPFQQRPSQGWGTIAQCEDPYTSARTFLRALARITSRVSMTEGQAAQAVQRSAYPDRYQQRVDIGRALVQALNSGGKPVSTPMTADQMVAALKAEGCKVVELPGWRTNNRAGHGPFGPVNGIVNHHTGSDVSDCAGYAASTLFNGYSSLPGPLCQAGLGNDGTIYLVGNGRCNHAGGGDPASLSAVQNDTTPMDAELRPRFGNSNGVDGNAHLYGLEIMYSGGHPMTAAQYDAMVRWDAAICRFHGWDGRSVIGHREWSSDKPDPGQVRMQNVRRDVNARLTGTSPVAPTPPVAPNPPPAPPIQGDDMTPDQSRKLDLIYDQLVGPDAKTDTFPGWPTQRLGVDKQENLTLVDYLRRIDRQLNSALDLSGRPAADKDNAWGSLLSLRAELRAYIATHK